MNHKHSKLLHYVLIILLMIAPLRSVFAVELSHCDMADDMADDMGMFTKSSVDLVLSSSTISNYKLDQQNEQINHQCCCCDDDCSSNCDMGMTVSLWIHTSSYSPVFVKTENVIVFSPELQLRALTPPSRPPLIIS